MKPVNNNGEPIKCPECDYVPHKHVAEYNRNKKHKKIIILTIVLVFLVPIVISTSWSSNKHAYSTYVAIETEGELAQTSVEVASVLDRFPNLSVIDGVGIAGSLRFSVEDVCRLYINIRHGNISIGTHDEDSVILIDSPGSINYNLNRSRGVLDITGNHQVISIHVPHSVFDAIFEYVTIEARHSTITLKGYDSENTFLSENLSVTNQHGAIILSDIVISGQLDIANRHGNITIHNVIADSDQLNVTNPHGRVFVS